MPRAYGFALSMLAPLSAPSLFNGNGQVHVATSGANLAFGQATKNDAVDSQRSALRRYDKECYFCRHAHASRDDKGHVVCRDALDSGYVDAGPRQAYRNSSSGRGSSNWHGRRNETAATATTTAADEATTTEADEATATESATEADKATTTKGAMAA